MAGQKGWPTTDAVEILHPRFVEADAESEALLEEIRAEAEVARTIEASVPAPAAFLVEMREVQ